MNDRVLLELAAKAAGVAGRFIEEIPEGGYPRYRCGIERVGSVVTMWNPLRDDGDALRLAVKLNLLGALGDEHAIGSAGMHNADPYAATRRAITSAAAEIGRSM